MGIEIGMIDFQAESTQNFITLSVVSYHSFLVSPGAVAERTIPDVSWRCQFGYGVVDALELSNAYAVAGVVEVFSQNCPRVGFVGGAV